MEYTSDSYIQRTAPLLLVIRPHTERLQALLNAKLITEADLKTNWKEELDNLPLKGIPWLYHFSPKCNLTSILTHGLMSRAYASASGITISQYGGNQISHDQSDSFGYTDFIHLCFCQDHPMMFRVAQETKQNLVLFAIDPIVIAFKGTQLTDQNAASNAHQTISSLGSMPSEVIEATKQRYVSRSSGIFGYHQAEVMVKQYIPPFLIADYMEVKYFATPVSISSVPSAVGDASAAGATSTETKQPEDADKS
ncbi:MAG TPA: DUF4433 domain-containing protein [Candidatus Anaerobiospirillum pullistercoris]|uniref:DUF4433 domain-containing protein n=1 Tax=Candidatus Anaerobiospirillum pullistercoris TaxID=2838452 RepID=A0A9D2AZZ1_9GAMM|nr:DUF4433 domain-containing protein [Candidatus Anaerobiospirillum pullistercoris]